MVIKYNRAIIETPSLENIELTKELPKEPLNRYPNNYKKIHLKRESNSFERSQ